MLDTPSGGFTISGTARRGGAGGLAGLFSRSGDRIRTDPAIVQALPGVRLRAVALLEAMPAGWWRGLAHRGAEPSA